MNTPKLKTAIGRRSFLAGTATLGALPGLALAGRRPNILLIIADDLGKKGLAPYGPAEFKTPALNRLARQGLVFDRFYVNPNCSPTRAEMMTGLYPARTGWLDGMQNLPESQQELDPTLPTYASILRAAGYATAIAGKWHIGRIKRFPDHPREVGFNRYMLGLGYTGNGPWPRFRVLRNGAYERHRRGYMPRLQAKWLSRFIERKRSRPWLAVMAHHLPHVPFAATPKTKDLSIPDGDPAWFEHMVAELDRLTGRLVRRLDQSGQADNTLVIFTTDNGTAPKARPDGGKRSLTEAGINVPFIARWTGVIEPGRTSELADAADLLPTFAGLAQAIAPQGDGQDMQPIWSGGAGKPYAFAQWAFGWSIMDRDWKLTSDGELTWVGLGAPVTPSASVRTRLENEALRRASA